jgi:hypothetical protein
MYFILFTDFSSQNTNVRWNLSKTLPEKSFELYQKLENNIRMRIYTFDSIPPRPTFDLPLNITFSMSTFGEKVLISLEPSTSGGLT